MEFNGPGAPSHKENGEEALFSAFQQAKAAYEEAIPETKLETRDAYRRALKAFTDHVFSQRSQW